MEEETSEVFFWQIFGIPTPFKLQTTLFRHDCSFEWRRRVSISQSSLFAISMEAFLSLCLSNLCRSLDLTYVVHGREERANNILLTFTPFFLKYRKKHLHALSILQYNTYSMMREQGMSFPVQHTPFKDRIKPILSNNQDMDQDQCLPRDFWA